MQITTESMQGFYVRRMLEDDLAKVMEIENAAYEIPWTEKVFQDCLKGRDECWVAVYNGNQCGHAIVSHVLDETHLLNICISPTFARQGLGRKLLKFLIEQAIDNHSSVFFLEVRASNEAAIQLYFTEGFNEVGVRPNYYPAISGREDAVLMTLELSVDHFV